MFDTKDTQFKGSIGHATRLEVKQVTDEGVFEGYGSVYGNIDNGGDIVLAGAFDKSLQNKSPGKVKMLLQHDTRRPIGVWDDLYSDSKGLVVKGRLLLGTTDGKETYEFMKAGAIDGLSIGYRVQDSNYDRDSDIRTIIKADLMEVSAVTFPMNELAIVNAVKSGMGIKTIREFEQFLHVEGGFSAKAAKAIAASGFKPDLRDEAGKSLDLRDEANTMSAEDFSAFNQLADLMRA